MRRVSGEARGGAEGGALEKHLLSFEGASALEKENKKTHPFAPNCHNLLGGTLTLAGVTYGNTPPVHLLCPRSGPPAWRGRAATRVRVWLLPAPAALVHSLPARAAGV